MLPVQVGQHAALRVLRRRVTHAFGQSRRGQAGHHAQTHLQGKDRPLRGFQGLIEITQQDDGSEKGGQAVPCGPGSPPVPLALDPDLRGQVVQVRWLEAVVGPGDGLLTHLTEQIFQGVFELVRRCRGHGTSREREHQLPQPDEQRHQPHGEFHQFPGKRRCPKHAGESRNSHAGVLS